MRCSACGQDAPAGARFCPECGEQLAAGIACAACGAANPASHRFCGACGERLGAADAPAASADRAPRDYTPRHLAERILTSRSALEGERKQVTVLFADVSGSVGLSEQVDPEAWHGILDRFFQVLSDGVHRFEGTVNQYTGDGIMALFGAPIAHEDHAQRACYAALHLREALRRYADELRLSQGLNFSVRMGLNSGEVVVGKIGDDLRMDYTAQGHTVGLAARMQQLAESGRIQLTDATARLVGGYFRLRDMGAARVRGARESVGVFELEGLGEIRTRLEVSQARGLSRFVGRANEMALLESALERTLAGEGQVVGVVAEAGTGKSRLCFEFLERCRARGLAVRQAHGVAHGKMLPFLPVLQLLRDLFEIEERDPPQLARHKIAGALLLRDRQFEEALPLLFEFLGVPDPERPSPSLAPAERERRLLGIARRLFETGGERGAGVVLIEDLHWVDAATEAFLADAVDVAPRTRTLLLLNFRPEYAADWMRSPAYQQIPLRALGPPDVAELLGELLGGDASLAGLPERIAERTGGNPFFVEEVFQGLVESGKLEGSRGAYRLVEPVERLAIPDSVQAVLSARIDRLAEREKQLLQTASVIGKEFPEGVLREVAELPEPELADALRRLVTGGFLYEQALYPEAEYAFKHPLTQEVAYDSQLRERRARLHGAVARALTRGGAEGHADRAALLAHHFERAGEALEAARWHRSAAEWTGLSRADQAFPHWQRVRELADELAASSERDELGALARVQLLVSGARIGASAEEMTALFQEGEALARRRGASHTLGRLLTGYGIYRVVTTGRIAENLPRLREAVALLDETDDVGFQIAARYNLGMASFTVDVREALRLCDEALERLGDDPQRGVEAIGFPPRINFLWIRSWMLIFLGRYSEAAAISDELQAAARESGDLFTRMVALRLAGQVRGARGEVSGLLDLAQRGVELAGERGGVPAVEILARMQLGEACLLLERWEQALGAFGRATRLIRETGTNGHILPACLGGLARAALGAGDAEAALEVAEEAVETVRERGHGLGELEARIQRARARTRLRGAAAAGESREDLDAAEALLESVGIESLRPELLEARAELSRATGDPAQCERQLREARAWYVERGAHGHAQRIDRLLATPGS